MSTVRLDQIFLRSEHMVGRRIADEFILVPLARRAAQVDSLYNLNRVGAFIWEHLDGLRSGAEIVKLLLKQFDVGSAEVESDYLTFMEQLLAIDAVHVNRENR